MEQEIKRKNERHFLQLEKEIKKYSIIISVEKSTHTNKLCSKVWIFYLIQ